MLELDWTTVVWSACGAVCALLALMHLALWLQRRGEVVFLLSAVACLGGRGPR